MWRFDGCCVVLCVWFWVFFLVFDMGVPKNKEACPWSNPCWPDGKTPYWLNLVIAGSVCNPFTFLPVPNGNYQVEQVESDTWYREIGGWSVTVRISNTSLFVTLRYGVNDLAFFGYVDGHCPRTVENDDGQTPDYTGGMATVGYEGPAGATGQGSELAENVGVLDPPNCQFEYLPTADGKQQVRIAQKKDKTCVYVKRESEF